MSSAICFNLDQSVNLSSGNRLIQADIALQSLQDKSMVASGRIMGNVTKIFNELGKVKGEL